MFTRVVMLLWLPVFLFLSCGIAQGKEYKQSQALTGLTTAKIFFDVNIGIPDKLVLRLSLIDKTISQLKAAGVKSDVVISFRGKASKFVTNGEWYVEKDEQIAKVKVHKWLEDFSRQGIYMEQCLIAANLFGIDPEDIRTEVEVTQNGYVSMVAYQNRGFAVIPMD
ncbi:MAG: DsrE family protein [Desulfocapsa sp.]|nr:DsrE family protein [Desulfocapsa sp.]